MANLIVLSFGSNCCYPEITDYEPKKIPRLEVDTEKMTWTYHDGCPWSQIQTNRIGEARYLGSGGMKAKSGVIGVFTKDTKQIQSLVYAWKEASADLSYNDD